MQTPPSEQPRFVGLLRYGLLMLAGILQAFSTAWPWDEKGSASGTLQVLALAAALVLLQGMRFSEYAAPIQARQRLWQGFWRGWCFATTWLTATFWWLFISLHTYGGLPGWFAALAVLLLAAALALYYAIAFAIWSWALPHAGMARRVVLFAALWLVAELCRGVFFTGFPWGAIGYAHVDSVLAGYASWIGVYGIGALAAASAGCLSALPALFMRTRGQDGSVKHHKNAWVRWGALAGVLLVIYGTAAWQKQAQRQAVSEWSEANPGAANANLHVALLQGNIPQEEKFQPNGGMELALEWYWQQIQESKADVIVLPETALPLVPHMLPEGYWQDLQQRFADTDGPQQAVLIGMFGGNAQQGYANAAVGMASGGARAVGGAQADLSLPATMQTEYSYAKHHLVPFGEFIPFGFRWFVNMMRIPLGSQQRGALAQPRMLFKGERLQPNICYEDLFGEELAAGFINPAEAPTILVNMSNIAWFGDTVAIDQHRNISRMRAMELARPMLRATNTGATAVIDETGRVLQELPRLTRGVLQATVKGNKTQPTFFAWWAARWSLWPLWGVGLVGIALAWPWRKRTKV